jgi:hypothetical protein
MEWILEPSSAWYVDLPLWYWCRQPADNLPGSDIPLNAITVTLATSGTLAQPRLMVVRH